MSDTTEDNMSFLGHLEELRWRLVKSVIAILIFAVGIFYFTEWITNNVFLSLASPDFPTFRFFCWAFNICSEEVQVDFQSVKVSGQFSTNLLMAVVGGLIIAFPYVFHQIWGFIKPGLKHNEIKTVKGIVGFVSVLFFTGVAFGYYVISPLTIQFFGNWKMAAEIENNFMINDYLSVIIYAVLFTGIFFLLPVVILIFSKLGVVSPAFLKKYRKHAFVIVLVLSAIITPPDLFTQIIVSIPILLLYEMGILISKRIEKKRIADSIL